MNNCLKALQEDDILHHTLGVSLLEQLVLESPKNQVSSILDIIKIYIVSKTNKLTRKQEVIKTAIQNIDAVALQECRLISDACKFLLHYKAMKSRSILLKELCFSYIDLRNIENKSQLSFSQCDFSDCTWFSFELPGTWITDCTFDQIRIESSNFDKGHLDSCTFKDVKINASSFRYTVFQLCDFHNVFVQNSDLSGVNFLMLSGLNNKFERCNFSQSELDIQSLLNITPTESDFSDAILFVDLPTFHLVGNELKKIEIQTQKKLDEFIYEIGREPKIASRIPDIEIKISIKPNPNRAYEWKTINKKRFRRFVVSRKWIDQPYTNIGTYSLDSPIKSKSNPIKEFIKRKKSIRKHRKIMREECIHEIGKPPEIIAHHPDFKKLKQQNLIRAYQWIEIDGEKYRQFVKTKEWIDEPPEDKKDNLSKPPDQG